MSSKPTLRDIAEATGVSTASVSMILNGKSLERFSSQRVASVLAEAERIGYRTPSARCSGRQIAILSPSVSNPYHTMMISGIDAAASAAGYQTAIYNTYWNPRTESHLLDTLDFSRVAGIIFAMTPTQPAKVRELSRRVPIVAVGDRVTDCGIDTVDVDNFGATLTVLLSLQLNQMLHGPWRALAESIGATQDVSRFGAEAAKGIGFLGAGTIIITARQQVKGLTTAAGLWASACLGLAIGAGFYACAFISMLFMIACMYALPPLERRMTRRAHHMNISLEIESM